jgi:hypothetical protein
MSALFDGLNSFPDNLPSDLPVDFPSDFPTNFSTSDPSMTVNRFSEPISLPVPGAHGPGSFVMDQLHAAVDELQAYGSPHWHSHNGPSVVNQQTLPPAPVDHQLPSTPHSPLVAPNRASAPASAARSPAFPLVGPPASLDHPSPLYHRATQPVPASRTGTAIDLSELTPARQAPRSSTRNLVARARAQARSPSLSIPQPLPASIFDLRAASLSPPPRPLLLRRPPLRKSLRLPLFLGDNEDGNSSSDQEPNRLRSPTPVSFDDTDIDLHMTQRLPITQARSRAARYFNVRLLPRHSTAGFLRIPTILELRTNASKVYTLSCRRNRSRKATATESSRNRNILSSAELTPNQRMVMPRMEFHVLRDILWVNPWPELGARTEYLSAAQRYAIELTGVPDDEDSLFTTKFLDTVSASMHSYSETCTYTVIY